MSDTVDISTLPPGLQLQIKMARWEASRRDLEVAAAAEGYDAMLDLIAPAYRRNTPFMPACVYHGRYIPSEHEVTSADLSCVKHRPVIMFGCRARLVAKFTYGPSHSRNGYAEEILRRLIRLKRLTCFTFNEYESEVWPIIRKIGAKHGCSYHYYQRVDFCVRRESDGSGSVLINGKIRHLNAQQIKYIGALYAIVRKTDRDEKRIQALRNARRDGAFTLSIAA